MNKKSYFRPAIDAMSGYTPGKQIRGRKIIKLNTNENPYPASPKVQDILQNIDMDDLRRYPQPMGDDVRDTIAELFGFERSNIILGNGSDDILTIAIRSFVGDGDSIAIVEPTYSLYEVLADIQGANTIKIPLEDGFTLPQNLVEKASAAKLMLIPRPNAPTGNIFPINEMRELCEAFDGVVLIDEAYADFADNNCIELAKEYSNVVVSRTLSKSYALAGIRFGFAISSQKIIDGMLKVKDSYNVNFLTQKIADVALKDQSYLKKITKCVIDVRENVAEQFKKMNFKVIPSQANFLLVSPPNKDGESYYDFLLENDFLTRYFPGETTGQYVRISIGTKEEMDSLLRVTQEKFI